MNSYMWLQPCGEVWGNMRLVFRRYSFEPEYPHEDSHKHYGTFVLKVIYE